MQNIELFLKVDGESLRAGIIIHMRIFLIATNRYVVFLLELRMKLWELIKNILLILGNQML